MTIDDVPVFYRSAGELHASAREPRTLYLHDAMMSSDDFVSFLERTGGLAPDLIGFGRSGKGGHLDYSPGGMVDFAEDFLAELESGRLKLVGHGGGRALGLLLGMRHPGRAERWV